MLIGATISALVRLDLRQPPFPIADGWYEVVWTAVPEAPVDENREPESGERDVDPPPRQTGNGVLDAKPSPATMEFPTERRFWMSPFPTLLSEALADSRVGR